MSEDSRGKHDVYRQAVVLLFLWKEPTRGFGNLIAGPSVFVCDECVELCNDIIPREELEERAERTRDKLPKPQEIKKVLDEYVIGQERAKRVLSVTSQSLQATADPRRRRRAVHATKWNSRRVIFS